MTERRKRTPKRPRKRAQEKPTERIPGLYYPVPDMTPDEFFKALGNLKREAELEIDRLLDFLDRLDAPNEDLEPVGDDEPSLGSFDRLLNQEHSWKQRSGSNGSWCEPGYDRELDRADDEPSLGAPERHPVVPYPGIWWSEHRRDYQGSQVQWADGDRRDRECDVDDEASEQPAI